MKREKEIIKVLLNEMSFIEMELVYTVSNIWSLVNRDIKLLLRLA
jgi:hypothetical protein